jgi:RNA polymerase sigma-70 factor (ECF subfamily)
MQMRLSCVERAWRSHEAELRRYLLRRLRDRDAAEDLAQDVFVRAAGQGQGFCSVSNPRAWLFRVAHNALVDFVRLRHQAESIDDLPLPAPVSEDEPLRDLEACIVRTLPTLAEQDRQALQRADLDGLSQRALAVSLGLSLSGAKSRVQRARARLRAALVARCGIQFDERGRIVGHRGPSPAPTFQIRPSASPRTASGASGTHPAVA